jgi:hypothetical protein
LPATRACKTRSPERLALRLERVYREQVRQPILRSYFMGRFECSTPLRTDGKRLDLINSTGHECFAEAAIAGWRISAFDHPGRADDRHCPNGLWGYSDAGAHRPLDADYAEELRRQAAGTDGEGRTSNKALDVAERDSLDRVAGEIVDATRRSRDASPVARD